MARTKTKTTAPTRAVGYVRISKYRDDETSTETQEERIRAHCAAQGWAVVDIVTEPGRSAWKASRSSRPGFKKALGLVAAGAADVLVVWKINRAARNTRDTLDLVTELEGYGATFASVTEQFDTSTPMGVVILTVIAALAQMESTAKSENIGAWQDRRLLNGATPTGPRPFGYQREASDDPQAKWSNRLVIDPHESEVIKDAAVRVLAGDSLRSIVADYAAAQVVGKSGEPLSHRALRAILMGPTIAACRETEPNVFVPSKGWDAILDRSTWDDVRTYLDNPSRRTSPGNGRRWLLSGIARCGRCDAPMNAKPHNAGPRYHCVKCHLSIEAVRVDDIVQRHLLALLNPAAWRRLRQGRSVYSTHSVLDTSYEEALSALTARFAAGDIDGAQWASLAEGLRRQQQAASTPPPSLPDVADLGKAWHALELEQRRLVIATATESLTIRPSTPRSGFDESRIVWTPVD
jgi:DNA invertase Pin-like site-specific DNA recombinase